MHDSPSPPPRRPLVRAAFAAACGAFAGRMVEVPRPFQELALACLAGAWIALRAVDGRSGGDARTPRASTLLLVAALAAWSAVRAPELERPFEGRWQPERPSRLGVTGLVERPEREPQELELPRAAAAAGEWIRVDPIEAPKLEARGPAPPPDAPGRISPRVTWSVRSDEVVRLARTAPWDAWTTWVRRARDAVLARCDAFEPVHARGLARALTCGDMSELDPELSQRFTRTGLRHLLAVSGAHVSLLAALALYPWLGSRRLRGGRGFALAAAIAAVLAVYAGLTGSQAPVRRAAVALALVVAAPLAASAAVGMGSRRAGSRRADTLSLWSLGLLLECAFDVRTLFSASMQLSYLATLGLIVGTRPLSGLLDLVLPAPQPSLGATAARTAALAWIRRAVVTGVAASACAVGATGPLIAATFGEWAPIGVLATPLVTPLISWLLVSVWLAVAAPGLVPVEVFELPCRMLVATVEAIDALPGTPHVLPHRPLWLTASGVALLAVAVRARAVFPRRLAAGTGFALASACLVPWTARPAELEAVVLDVGHGTCVAVRARAGPAWVFDAGSRDRRFVGASALGPLLSSWEVGDVAVVLSHDDADHASALPWLIERHLVARWSGALPAPLAERLAHTAGSSDVARGLAWLTPVGRGALEAALVRGRDEDGNEGSRTLWIGSRGRWLALHGDATELGLDTELRLPRPAGRVLASLWPHHGDDSPWTARLLAREAPDEVWISAGDRSPVEAELARRGQRFRTTWRDGPLSFPEPKEVVRP